ncbi:unnamed protein product [Prunus armeniaca]|uniref:Uncharacterized protein n=1 Tax=Prunus armeniaca TaxID=36596 RepID=A0A6J5UVN2_PRUAR|nr:unnamed protein product [Prunus armeniaca]
MQPFTIESKIGTNSIYGIIERDKDGQDQEQSLSCAIKNEKKDGKEQELRDAIEIDGYETSPKSHHFLKLPLLL